MKQRVSVVRSFVSRPSALLMDEPFAALDYQTRLILQQDLLRLWDEEHKSIIFVTHDIEEAILLSDRIIVLSAQPAHVVSSFSVDLPRPRHAGLTGLDEFLRLKMEVLTQLGLASDLTELVPSKYLSASSL
jgi:NitT/TauT family transport system ATP-binding protein